MTEPLRRFGAIGDVHAEDEALALALAHLRGERLDAILAVGDFVDGRGDPQRALDLLIDADVIAVRGNHDRWFVDGPSLSLRDATTTADLDARAQAFLRGLLPTRLLPTIAGDLLLCHGLGEDDMARLRVADTAQDMAHNEPLQRLLKRGAALVVSGHTHEPNARTIGGVTFVNAGTLHREDDPCCVVVDLTERYAQFFDVDVDAGKVHPWLRFALELSVSDVWGQF